MPMVREGDDLAALIVAALRQQRDCATATWWWWRRRSCPRPKAARSISPPSRPRREAVELAAEVGKDPRLVEVILSESTRVVRSRPNLIIVQHRLGFVMANAGVDQSNVAPADGVHRALLLPLDPDASAEAICARSWQQRFGVPIGVIISDSFGRAWRRGTVRHRDRCRRPAVA